MTAQLPSPQQQGDTLSQVRSQAQRVSQAQQSATSLSAQALTLPDELRKSVSERFASNPLLQQREQVLEGALNVGTKTRANIAEQVKGGTIFSPSQQLAIEQSRRSAAVSPLSTLNEIIGVQRGGLENVIGAASRSAQAQAQLASGAAQQEQQQFQNLFQVLEFEERQRQFQIKQAAANAKSEGLDLGFLFGGQPTEDPPQSTPQEGVGALSPQGEWRFTGNEWVPAKTKNDTDVGRQFLIAAVASGELSATEAKFIGEQSGIIPDKKELEKQEGAQKALTQLSTITAARPQLGVSSVLRPGKTVGSLVQFNNAKTIAGQVIAKQFESGRMSDEDRSFYQKLLPGALDLNFDSKIAGLKFALEVNAGLRDPNLPRLQSTDGSIIEYDSVSDPDYKEDVQKGLIPIL